MLGFLVKTYPKISETFVLQEILGLQNEAYGINIFSMQQPTDDNFHSAFKSVTASVDYLSFDNWQQQKRFKIHFMFMCTRPWRYLSTLLLLMKRAEGGTFKQFCQVVYFSRLIQEKSIRHIHAHFASDPAGLAELAGQLCGITYSISAHAKDIYLNRKSSLKRKIAHARFVVTCTDYNRRFLQSINQSNTPVYKLYHGIDSVRVKAENEQEELIKSSVLRILSVGRLREKKGFPCLITACHLLVQSGYRFQCDIVGYGPDKKKLEALINRYQLQGTVNLLGKLTHEKLVALYRQTAIFALPCQIAEDGDRDGIPNVLMEAMTFAIPVVSTNVSGIPELIENNSSGIIVDANNPQVLFKALKHLFDHPEKRQKLGEAGRQRVSKDFAAHQHLSQLKELLVDAMQLNVSADKNNTVTGEQHG